MKIGPIIYNFILALWVGGMFIFTFLVTPIIFQSFGKDTAGEIVAKKSGLLPLLTFVDFFPKYISIQLVNL